MARTNLRHDKLRVTDFPCVEQRTRNSTTTNHTFQKFPALGEGAQTSAATNSALQVFPAVNSTHKSPRRETSRYKNSLRCAARTNLCRNSPRVSDFPCVEQHAQISAATNLASKKLPTLNSTHKSPPRQTQRYSFSLRRERGHKVHTNRSTNRK